jgi:hypothetical protein
MSCSARSWSLPFGDEDGEGTAGHLYMGILPKASFSVITHLLRTASRYLSVKSNKNYVKHFIIY